MLLSMSPAFPPILPGGLGGGDPQVSGGCGGWGDGGAKPPHWGISLFLSLQYPHTILTHLFDCVSPLAGCLPQVAVECDRGVQSTHPTHPCLQCSHIKHCQIRLSPRGSRGT